jgi:hypothetical protein
VSSAAMRDARGDDCSPKDRQRQGGLSVNSSGAIAMLRLWLLANAIAASRYSTGAVGANDGLTALIEPSKSSPSLPQTVDSATEFWTLGIWNPLRWRSAFSMFRVHLKAKGWSSHAADPAR